MKQVHEDFKTFLEESPNRLEYLLKLDENLRNIRIENIRERVVDCTEKAGLLYEYTIELSRNSLRAYISIVEFADNSKEKGKHVEVLMDDGDSFLLDTENLRPHVFSLVERLFLNANYASFFLKVLLHDFKLYNYIQTNSLKKS